MTEIFNLYPQLIYHISEYMSISYHLKFHQHWNSALQRSHEPRKNQLQASRFAMTSRPREIVSEPLGTLGHYKSGAHCQKICLPPPLNILRGRGCFGGFPNHILRYIYFFILSLKNHDFIHEKYFFNMTHDTIFADVGLI